MSLEDQVRSIFREEIDAAMAKAHIVQPAPYPVGVSVEEAARLISVGPDTIRSMVATGRLRTLDLDGARRTVIPVAALFELDPGHSPGSGLRLVDDDSPRRTG